MEDVRTWNPVQPQPQLRHASTLHLESAASSSPSSSFSHSHAASLLPSLLPSPSLSPSPSQQPPHVFARPPLRPSRSAANLRSPTIDDVPLPPLPPRPRPACHDQDVLGPPPPYEMRRVRSSSALSFTASTSASSSVVTTVSSSAAAQQDAKPSKLRSAFEEVQFRASGLIGKAVESNKHFSVIRHSIGIVLYRGPDTSVAFTILSDEPLPANRTVWLQQKGHSGNMGMAIKAWTNARGDWIDVTPAQEAQVEHIRDRERAMQRDIERFVSKASGNAKRHLPRETHIVRIPAAASDGYYRLVVCGSSKDKAKDSDKAKVLCECTVFRVASLSADAAVVRGASLTSMPLEMGIKFASTIGSQFVKKYTGVAGAVVQNRAGKFVAKHSAKKAATVALKGYHGLGGQGLQGAVQESWKRQRAAGPGSSAHTTGEYTTTTEVVVSLVGPERGPEPPFPIKFKGRVTRGAGRSTQELGFPTANLADVPDRVRTQLPGVFAAWAMLLPGKKNIPDGLSPDWHPAVVTIAAPRGAAPAVFTTNSVCVHVLHDFRGASFLETGLKILLMGWLHAPAPPTASATEVLARHELDINITLASLERDRWLAHETVARLKASKPDKTLSDHLDHVTGMVVQGADKIPLHWAAVRSESETLRDQSYGVGGIWIRRDARAQA